MKRRAFTLIELMVTLILLTLLLTCLWEVFSSTRKNAQEIMANHSINDELDRTLIKITDDVREANQIVADFPPVYEANEIENLKSDDEKNQLKIMKVEYDFTKDPSTLGEGEKNYTQEQIRYFLEKDEDENGNTNYSLIREMTPYSTAGEPEESNTTVYTILTGISECIFYRVKDPDASRTGNIYIKFKLGRLDNGKYANESIVSVKERGAMPD